jgi:hypothetical protein
VTLGELIKQINKINRLKKSLEDWKAEASVLRAQGFLGLAESYDKDALKIKALIEDLESAEIEAPLRAEEQGNG